MFHRNDDSYKVRKSSTLKLSRISVFVVFLLLSFGINPKVINSTAGSTFGLLSQVSATTLESNDTAISNNFYVNLTNDRVDYTTDIGFDFYEELPAPGAKDDGRGEPLEKLISNYGDSYVADPILNEDVVRFRRWEWQALYQSLDQKAKANPDHLNTYRLQAEVYLVNKNYREAFSQLDRILRRDPSDIHALALSILAAKVTGENEQAKNRLEALKFISPEAEEAVQKVLNYSDEHSAKNVNYGSDQLTDMVPDVIAVFGQSPNADGTPSPALLTRLEKTKEMAERYPDIPIVLSGGPVRYQYAEADVMAKWLIENGISKDRLILDDVARDTPGNAVGMVKAFKEIGAKKVLAIGTILHLPRATTALKLYADSLGYDISVDSAGSGPQPSLAKQGGERLYTYVNAMRAALLYTKDDFDKFSIRTDYFSLPETSSAVFTSSALPKTNSDHHFVYSLIGFFLVVLPLAFRKKGSKIISKTN